MYFIQQSSAEVSLSTVKKTTVLKKESSVTNHQSLSSTTFTINNKLYTFCHDFETMVILQK